MVSPNPLKRQRLGGGADEGSGIGALNDAMMSSSDDSANVQGIPPLDAALSASDVNKLSALIHDQLDVLLECLATGKAAEKKENLRLSINTISRSLNVITSAYLAKLASDICVDKINTLLATTCTRIENAAASITHAYASCNAPPSVPTFSNVVSRSGNFTQTRAASTTSVSLTRGKSFTVNSCERIIIGPREDAAERITSSEATKNALRNVISPTDLKLNVKNVGYGLNNTIIIDGDNIKTPLQNSSEILNAAGLEIKPEVKLKPRLIIHDIPEYIDEAEILSCIAKQNVPDISADDIKVIYMYPVRENKQHRSCIIETTPELRIRLLNRGKIGIKWDRCRIADHITIRLCYKCSDFGHIATDCQKNARCGNCAGNHETCLCKSNRPKCANCIAANHTDVSHAATDKSKCPILRKKINRKITFIDYGSQ